VASAGSELQTETDTLAVLIDLTVWMQPTSRLSSCRTSASLARSWTALPRQQIARWLALADRRPPAGAAGCMLNNYAV
jgi:hypothetical protein